jgi:hypothetical protein
MQDDQIVPNIKAPADITPYKKNLVVKNLCR